MRRLQGACFNGEKQSCVHIVDIYIYVKASATYIMFLGPQSLDRRIMTRPCLNAGGKERYVIHET